MPFDALRRALHRISPTPGETWLVGVSGGGDSVFLLRALHELAPGFGLALHAAHLDHGLRGEESRGDAAFVRSLCSELGIPLTEETLPAGGLERRGERPAAGGVPALKSQPSKYQGLEAEARDARHAFLERARQACGARRIALAHHAGDQAETVLLNLSRGAGPRGLAAMREAGPDGRVVRPLLRVPREAIRGALRARGWAFREDSTNADPSRPRNRVRHRVLPELAAGVNPAAEANLAASAELFAEWAALADELAAQAVADALQDAGEGILALDCAALLKYPQVVRKYAFGKALEGTLGLRSLSRVHLGSLDNLLASKEGGRRVRLPRGFEAAREACRLVVYPAPEADTPFESHPLPVPGVLDLPEGLRVSARRVDGTLAGQPPGPDRVFLDPRGIEGPLVVRRRMPGDRFEPLGLRAETKLKDFLIAARVPRRLRAHLWLLSDAKSVLWVLDLRPSERARILAPVEDVLEIRIEHTHGSRP